MLVPDPDVQLRSTCGACGKTSLGELRVYAGTNPQRRGSIAQTCTDVQCNWTVYHTEPFAYHDAKQLLNRVMARLIDPTAYPVQRTPAGAVLRPAPPVAARPTTATGQVKCSNEACLTKKGERTNGNKACVSHMCLPCCNTASQDAQQTKTLRSYCRPHKTEGYEGEPMAAPVHPSYPAPPVFDPALAPIFPALPAPAHAPQPAAPIAPALPAAPAPLPPSQAVQTIMSLLQAAQAQEHASIAGSSTASHGQSQFTDNPASSSVSQAINANMSRMTPPSSAPSSSTATVAAHPPPSTTSIRDPPAGAAGPSAHRGRHANALARPISALWQEEARRTHNAYEVTKVNKTKAQEMAHSRKITIMLVVWFKRGADALKLEAEVPTYPNIQLESIQQLVSIFKLTPSSFIERWDAGEGNWVVCALRTVITIDPSNRLPLRFREGLLDDWASEDCPGLAHELQLQSRRPKRRGDDLVSPVKKRVFQPESPLSSTAVAFHRIMDAATSRPPIAAPNFCPPSSPRSSDSMPATNTLHPSTTSTPHPSTSTSTLRPPPTTAATATAIATHAMGSDGDIEPSLRVATMGSSTAPQAILMTGPALVHPGDMLGRSGRQWPSQFYICEISTGVLYMRNLMKLQKKSIPVAFSEAFNTPFRKTSYHKYIKIWDDASSALRAHFATYELQDRGSWTSFSAAITLSLSTMPKDPEQLPAHAGSLYSQEPAAVPSPQAHIDAPAHYQTADEDATSSTAPHASQSIASQHEVLCPFCDEAYPLAPSAKLQELRQQLEQPGRSYPDPMFDNPNHREAVDYLDDEFNTFCELHAFELNELPLATTNGRPWPQKLDFSRLLARLADRSLLQRLRQVIENPSSSVYFTRAASIYKTTNGKARATLAQRRLQVMAGQAAGYYGSKGFFLMFFYFLHIFSGLLDDDACRPLDQDQMLASVLVPEAAVLLIQEDLQLTVEDAMSTFDRSQNFGKILFPAVDDDPDIDNAIASASKQRQVVLKQQATNPDIDETVVKLEPSEPTLQDPGAASSHSCPTLKEIQDGDKIVFELIDDE
ncbi:hypothetical protein C2E23DRAFT_860309 [Lenzites betulinus]|nr:hypothetical protein C2E23DRAFT_860309 [Lenzites betulinus]